MNSSLIVNRLSGAQQRYTRIPLFKIPHTNVRLMHYVPPPRDSKSNHPPSSDHNHDHQNAPHSHTHLHNHLEMTSKEGLKITYIGLGFNVLLVCGKFVAGVVGHSAAMVADAAHSLTDMLSDVVTLWSVKLSSKPVDFNHPYGHGKFDSIGSLAVSGLLVATSVGIGYHSISAAFTPETPSQIALWAAVVSIAVKEVLFRATLAIGEKRRSGVLIAHAWHHRSDAYSSLVTLVGIGGAMMGIGILDPLAGLAVSGMIMKTAYSLGTSSIKELTDSVETEDVDLINKLMVNAEGVLSFTDVRVRKMGPYTIVDLTIQVDNHLSVSAAGQIAERVRRNIQAGMDRVKEVMVHVTGNTLHGNENTSSDEPLMRPQEQIEADVKRVLGTIKEIEGISHFLVHYEHGEVTVHIDIVVDHATKVAEVRKIAQRAKDEIKRNVTDIHHVDLHLELEEQDVQRVVNHQDKTM